MGTIKDPECARSGYGSRESVRQDAKIDKEIFELHGPFPPRWVSTPPPIVQPLFVVLKFAPVGDGKVRAGSVDVIV
jgi:hypothetical protein